MQYKLVNIFELNDEENMRECMLNLNFMAAVTVCNDFGAQENKVCHCFHCFPIYWHEVMRLNAVILVGMDYYNL